MHLSLGLGVKELVFALRSLEGETVVLALGEGEGEGAATSAGTTALVSKLARGMERKRRWRGSGLFMMQLMDELRKSSFGSGIKCKV